MRTYYVTNAIPYVNGDPHLGHALEFVQADVLARHARARGEQVRQLSGTDDHAGKNRHAAEAAGVPVARYVGERAAAFRDLAGPLSLGYDDFIETSRDQRHRPAVERLWRACRERGDLYQRDYSGRYCAGCEAFLTDDELVDGLCPEHRRAPEPVTERNWFFRLSAYAGALEELIAGGALEIQPAGRRNEALALIRGGLEDFSVSRPAARAGGWGIPVPDDPTQTIYVWFDALANYISALGYGTGAAEYDRWWRDGDERVHVVGKGVLRFHAVYWPAILLSAGEAPPTRVLVHDYLTVEGRKIGKSLGNGVAPAALAERYGVDALRWWLLRSVPRVGDADFTEAGLGVRADELADGLGNLASRALALAARTSPPPAPGDPAGLVPGLRELPEAIAAAVDRFDLRAAADALAGAIADANRAFTAAAPWLDARAAAAGDRVAAARLRQVLGATLGALAVIGRELRPFLPDAADRLEAALSTGEQARASGLFRKAFAA